MGRRPISRVIVSSLLIAAVVLPIVIAVTVGVGAILTASEDAIGGAVLGRIALAAGMLWVVNLVCLVLVQSINALAADDEEP